MIHPDLPAKALSIRQPWAWLIVNGHKTIENRDWKTTHRGPFAVHAPQGMTISEYLDCKSLAQEVGVDLPDMDELDRGGIVGVADVTGVTTSAYDNPWFFGPNGFILANQRPVDFIPCKGALSFFDWRRKLLELA